MKTSRAETTAAARERLERMAAPLTDMKNRLTGAVGEAHERLAGARDSAFDAIAEKPLRWSLVAFAAGLVVGAALGYTRGESKNSNW